MSAAAKVASARGTSLILLTVAYVAMSLAREYVEHLDDLERGRGLAAVCWEKDNPRPQAPAPGPDGVAPVPPAEVGDLLAAGTFTGFPDSRIEVRREGKHDTDDTLTCLRCPHRGVWKVGLNDKIRKQQDTCADELRKLANEASGDKGDDKDPWYESYRRLDNALFHKPVEVPVLGVKVTAFPAQIVIALLVLVLLVELRSRVRAVVAAQDLGAEEEWTAIDTEGRAESLVALLWIGALTAAPWITMASFITTVTGYLRVTGSATPLPIDILIVAACAAYVVASGWMCLSLLADLLRLRRARGEPKPPPPPGHNID